MNEIPPFEAAWFAQAAFLFYKIIVVPRGKILVVGMGNFLYQDEGIGVYVIGAMEKMPFIIEAVLKEV